MWSGVQALRASLRRSSGIKAFAQTFVSQFTLDVSLGWKRIPHGLDKLLGG